MYIYLKAIHIIFIVTWFAGMFYVVRLFIYNTEANEKAGLEKTVLQSQLNIMIKRLWLGITWPSAILTLILGPWLMFHPDIKWYQFLDDEAGRWLLIKLVFVLLLYAYHFTLHAIYKQEVKGIFKYSSQQLRVWNEVATILLVVIVMLATVKSAISWIWGLVGLIAFIIVIMSAVRIYKAIRKD